MHSQGSNASHAIAAVGGDGLYVGGDAGAGGWIEPRNGENYRWFFGHGLR